MEEEKDTKEEKDDTIVGMQIIIPECCQKGLDDCPHVVGRDANKKKKTNVGL